MAWSTLTSRNAGDAILASDQNITADNFAELAPFFSAWTSWTPAIYQNGSRTSTNTASRYLKVGKLVIATARVTITQAGSAGNRIASTLPPVTPQATSGDFPIGTFLYIASGGTRYVGSVVINNTFGASPGVIFHTYANDVIGNTPNFATANGDTLAFHVTYEAA